MWKNCDSSSPKDISKHYWWECKSFLEVDVATPLKCKINVKYNHLAQPTTENLSNNNTKKKKKTHKKDAVYILAISIEILFLPKAFFSQKVLGKVLEPHLV